MVYASCAILIATLALSAAAPILAVPLFPTLDDNHGHLVRSPAGPDSDLEMGNMGSAGAEPAAAPARTSSSSGTAATFMKIGATSVGVSGVVSGLVYGIGKSMDIWGKPGTLGSGLGTKRNDGYFSAIAQDDK